VAVLELELCDELEKAVYDFAFLSHPINAPELGVQALEKHIKGVTEPIGNCKWAANVRCNMRAFANFDRRRSPGLFHNVPFSHASVPVRILAIRHTAHIFSGVRELGVIIRYAIQHTVPDGFVEHLRHRVVEDRADDC
jgi:hypothetical protein